MAGRGGPVSAKSRRVGATAARGKRGKRERSARRTRSGVWPHLGAAGAGLPTATVGAAGEQSSTASSSGGVGVPGLRWGGQEASVERGETVPGASSRGG